MRDTENSCEKKCRLLHLFPTNPRLSMFTVSLFLGYALPVVVDPVFYFIASPTLAYVLYSDCFSCVDTTYGYYLHTRAPAAKAEVENVEESVTQSIADSLKVLGISTEVNDLLRGIEKTRIEKKQVMLYATFPRATGLLAGKVVAQWSRPEESLPVGPREGKIVLESNSAEVEMGEGMVSDGERTVSSPGVEYAVPDSTFPGLLIPSEMVKVSVPTTDAYILRARAPDDYEVSAEILDCLKGTIGKLGYLREVVTEEGSIYLTDKGIVVQAEEWSGEAFEVLVRADFTVLVRDVDVEFEGEDVRLVEEEKEVGTLKAIVFDNASIMKSGNELYAWERVSESVGKEAVADAALSVEDGEVSLQITPSPDATEEERKAIENMNDRLKEVTVLETPRYSVAIVEDPETGDTYLRIYDKEKNEVKNERITSVEPDPEDPSGLLIRTVDEEGNPSEHRIKVEVASDGTPVLKIDGESAGVLKTVQTPDGFLYFDPAKGEWQLINGVLAPLAEAFKNGIKMTFEGGMGVGRPAGGIVVASGPQREGGFALPFLSFEIVPLVLLIALIYVLIR